ncbi:serine/threonine protein kinase [Nocardioides psychrotolerans]|uniref:non-specific serine/threonine protein kinase n=1 Tax=Nocardioides psychrotolerans TaxID=1005945 RepID=A0A1I3E992_9ACTN|nr:serine/threonine-protein kinase [Nocardioides psychrotolerans]GEP37461.1 serine/threonine protein kinase [Nocardioides psychrotolerans]SFH95562.1 Serine/threonine protein kinase [Nocardioides psychrotolerans]
MPSRIGRYVVRRRIGAGGFATVWLAYDEQLDSPVAVKVLADNWTEDHHVMQRFLEEGRYLRRVESPHVVTVYDAGTLEDGRPYLVMTYADQGTLADRLELDGLTTRQALEVVRQVAAGLQALHDRDILHRDVKPANVLFRTVDNDLRAMVGDLGLGKALDMSSRLTMIAGTPSFVAPEQAQAEPLDARADQYSLGVLAYLLLAGRPPHTHADLTAAASPGEVPPLSTPERPVPAAADHVVRRALALKREERFASVTDFAAALADAFGDDVAPEGQIAQPWLPLDPQLTMPGVRPSPVPAARPVASTAVQAPPVRRRWPVVVVVVGALALAVGAGAGLVLGQQGTPADVEVSDASGTVSVTVPDAWDGAVADGGWAPPNDPDGAYPALSVGTSETWTSVDSRSQGVFLGLFPGEALPALLPQHPECEEIEDPVTETSGDPSTTVVHADCPGGVTVERVVQVAANRLLWVQVRSADRATANRVLDSVETHGL